MVDAKGLCSEWQSLLGHFLPVFTLGGWARFAQWITGTVLCSEEHTITQILTGLGLENQWRNIEHFAEYGSWDRETIVSAIDAAGGKRASGEMGKVSSRGN